MAETVAGRLERLRDRLRAAAERAGRKPDEITLVGVTKTLPPQLVLEGFRAGVRRFGENRFQESPEKIAAVKEALGSGEDPPEWHFIGQLQSNKVRKVLETFDWIQSLDRPKLIRRTDSIAEELGIRAQVLLQVSVSGAESQGGVEPDRLPDLLELAAGCDHLDVHGLMAIGPNTDDEATIHRGFARVRQLADRLGPQPAENIRLDILSMGMSSDYEIAVEEGATMVRIGSALFGPRGGQG
jgi:pyridoxal phosphate enzyme (YggS family)